LQKVVLDLALTKALYRLFYSVGLVLLCSLQVLSVEAEELQVNWGAPTTSADGSPLNDLAGYRLYYGTKTSQYSNTIDVGNLQTYTVLGLVAGSNYYFAVSAYDTAGNESELSTEWIHSIPLPRAPNPDDPDGDGIPNDQDPDSDNDGLLDEVEIVLGTDPYVADSDGDWVDDGDEVSAGSNPLDAGSSIIRLGNTICADWNSFLGGMWNVFEHVNLSPEPIRVETTLFSIQGNTTGLAQFTVPAGGQFDALIHDLSGRAANSYGRACSRHFGNPGDLDGRMVYYRPETDPSRGMFQFAIAMQMTRGKIGPQFVTLNTMHPSLAAGEELLLVTNWLQLTNLENTVEHGSLVYYAQDGSIIRSERVTLSAGQRNDLAGHAVGSSQIGVVEWRPDRRSSTFLFRNVRYLFDNNGTVESFDTAFQLEGMVGSGEPLYVPVDTVVRSSVLEIVNTTSQTTSVNVQVFGEQRSERQLVLAPHASEHIILDQMLGPMQVGYARIQGGSLGSVAAVAMHYGRRSDLGISYMFGIQAKPTLGTSLKGSYNTYLAQDTWLLSVSPEAQSVDVKMTRPDGSTRHQAAYEMSGVHTLHLNQFEESDNYGVIELVPSQRNSLASWALRVRGNDYIIPTPLR